MRYLFSLLSFSIMGGTPEAQAMAKYEIEMIAAGQNKSGGSDAYSSATSSSTYMNPYLLADPTNAAALMSTYQLSGYYDPNLMAQMGLLAATQPTSLVADGSNLAYSTQATLDPSAVAAAPTDPTAYYNDFWYYASYYGETAARQYYGEWSPPVGTPPPEGIVVAADPVSQSASGAASNEQASTTLVSSDDNVVKDNAQLSSLPGPDGNPSSDQTSGQNQVCCLFAAVPLTRSSCCHFCTGCGLGCI
jgi:hypothetical protein